jgi:hypothetical protein
LSDLDSSRVVGAVPDGGAAASATDVASQPSGPLAPIGPHEHDEASPTTRAVITKRGEVERTAGTYDGAVAPGDGLFPKPRPAGTR